MQQITHLLMNAWVNSKSLFVFSWREKNSSIIDKCSLLVKDNSLSILAEASDFKYSTAPSSANKRVKSHSRKYTAIIPSWFWRNLIRGGTPRPWKLTKVEGNSLPSSSFGRSNLASRPATSTMSKKKEPISNNNYKTDTVGKKNGAWRSFWACVTVFLF